MNFRKSQTMTTFFWLIHIPIRHAYLAAVNCQPTHTKNITELNIKMKRIHSHFKFIEPFTRARLINISIHGTRNMELNTIFIKSVSMLKMCLYTH